MNTTWNKVVIVTGGAQGIGKGIVSHLLEKGARVVIADHDEEAGKECVGEFGYEDRLLFLPTDVGDEESVKECITRTITRFKRIDGLVNNAAIADPGFESIEKASLAKWQKVIRINLTGCFLTVKYSCPHLRRTKGAIVNISSTRAHQSEPNTEAYSASKGGLVALTHSLAISLGPDIRVNCISPGWIEVCDWKKKRIRELPDLREIDHLQHPVGRVGDPVDIASMTGFLLSEEAGFITGQDFIIDGGMTRKMIYAE
ncbi:MAG: SDR family oxidoreductase [Desulfobulbaceae bacterium]|nr:SDR family oxidoreductase [Desulfobulbaceae bacterium]